jgi:hypothetical protein
MREHITVAARLVIAQETGGADLVGNFESGWVDLLEFVRFAKKAQGAFFAKRTWKRVCCGRRQWCLTSKILRDPVHVGMSVTRVMARAARIPLSKPTRMSTRVLNQRDYVIVAIEMTAIRSVSDIPTLARAADALCGMQSPTCCLRHSSGKAQMPSWNSAL